MTDYATALGVAELAMERLRPHCEKVELAGSLRRGRAQVSDIELVCQPKLVAGQVEMFGTVTPAPVVSPGFCAAVEAWPKVRGEPEGRYTRRVLAPGLELDLFMARADNFGLIHALRTGSAAWVYLHLAVAARRGHLVMKEGQLRRTDCAGRVPCPDEAAVWAALQVPAIPPQMRESPRVRNERFRMVPHPGEVIYKCPLCGKETRMGRGPEAPVGASRAWRSCARHTDAPEAQLEPVWVDLGGREVE